MSYKIGAGFKVLRLFYIQAIWSLVDYCALALLTLKPNQVTSLEIIQNRAMRTILAAPRWMRLVTSRVETYLPISPYQTKTIIRHTHFQNDIS